MTMTAVQFRPGVVADVTDYAAEGGWVDSDKVRFRDGFPECIGGWQKFIADTFTGVPRLMHAWAETSGVRDLAVGTATKLQLMQGEVIYNITPIRDSGTLTDPFTTTNGSAAVSVADSSHGMVAGDTAIYSGATAVGGLTLAGAYTVTSVTDANTYVITAASAATSGATGGGSVGYQYEIHVGPADAADGFGWSAGLWGGENWGDARSSAGVALLPANWSMDNWGEDLLASPRDAKLYVWDASAGTSTRATVVAASPTAAAFIVSPEDRHVIALGADGDPMAIAWCDQEDYTDWTPGAASTADTRRLLDGSRIVGGLRTAGEILIWTDTALYALQYTGAADYAFNLRRIGDSGSVVGPHAMAEKNGTAFWMGNKQFFTYNGRAQPISCPVQRTVFEDLDETQADKVFCGLNSMFNEVMWFYPSVSGGSGEPDRYVKLNYVDNVWDIGSFDRTAWVDSNDAFSTPLGISSDGTLYSHEDGQTADGARIAAHVESGDFDIGDGNDVMFLNRVIPDFRMTGAADIYLKSRVYPGDDQTSKGPFQITAATKFFNPRVRGRQVALRVETADLDQASYWRLGKLRFNVQPNGRK
jgi:hypothetical protein